MQTKLTNILQTQFNKTIEDCTNEELYTGLLMLVKNLSNDRKPTSTPRKLYYISAEFLIGKLLSNNLINLGIYDEIKTLLADNGKKLSDIEEIELEPSLGNGGLGRLAACFLDSIATLNLSGDGVGLNYHFGLFKQKFENHLQKEEKNPWITDKSWLNDTNIGFDVEFNGFTVHSKLYDIDVLGYQKGLNKLHLFDIDTIDETIVNDGISFDQKDIRKNLTLFLYPDDSTKEGQMLRIYQQYFMVSNAAQLILMEEKAKGHDLHELYKYVCIQINDTHPSMVIPELINRLVLEGIDLHEAIDIVSKTCAYTNHTILAEALEKWHLEDLKQVVPQLIPTIQELNAIAKSRSDNKAVQIIDEHNLVHMAHMDIHFGYSINGVASLHTEILKNSELKAFYELYPEKFNNKTNGITFRRWLLHCNNELSQYITSLIGDEYKTDATKLKDLLIFVDDETVLNKLLTIKQNRKQDLCNYLNKTMHLTLNPNSIFDIQIKRLHEYKRQQMNLLYIIQLLQKIRSGYVPSTPITFIFGAKAAPAYIIAKDIIHAILCLQDIIAKDPVASKYIQVVMVENYNVTNAEKLIPACDFSEQISLASKEASGTGNMKFMLNGAITIGTEDGANVEIHELVGDDNIYIFGESSDNVIAHYNNNDYDAGKYYNNDEIIKNAVDFLISEEMTSIGQTENLHRLHHELISKDWFMSLLDLKAYIQTKDQAYNDYEDRLAWAKKSLINIANAGYFSSDRTIAEYNHDIWHLDK
jgi:starch phosphorylase